MVTVLRGHGLRVVIFLNDHEPAHVHVFGDGEAKINLPNGDGGPELIWAQSMTAPRCAAPFGSLANSTRCCWPDGRKSMAELTDNQIDAALERGKLASIREPRAASAHYDGDLGRVVVELTNGCTFTFPTRLAQELASATGEQLAQVEVLGAGYGLHWEALDADLSIPGLLAGLFGTAAYMARHAGHATSPAKAAAARANGARGGRPRKSGLG